MLFDRGAQEFGRLIQFPVSFGAARRLLGFQRELTVDDDMAWRVWQVDQTIRPGAIRQRALQRIAVTGQRFGDDIIQLNFAKGASGLLIRQ